MRRQRPRGLQLPGFALHTRSRLWVLKLCPPHPGPGIFSGGGVGSGPPSPVNFAGGSRSGSRVNGVAYLIRAVSCDDEKSLHSLSLQSVSGDPCGPRRVTGC